MCSSITSCFDLNSSQVELRVWDLDWSLLPGTSKYDRCLWRIFLASTHGTCRAILTSRAAMPIYRQPCRLFRVSRKATKRLRIGIPILKWIMQLWEWVLIPGRDIINLRRVVNHKNNYHAYRKSTVKDNPGGRGYDSLTYNKSFVLET